MPSFRKYCISSFVVHILILFLILVIPDFTKKSYSFPEGYKVKMVNLPKGSMTAGSQSSKPKTSKPKPIKPKPEIEKIVTPSPKPVVKPVPEITSAISLEAEEKTVEETVEKTIEVPVPEIDPVAEEEEQFEVVDDSNSGSPVTANSISDDGGEQIGTGVLGMESGDAGVVAHLDTDDFEYLWYLENVQRKIASNWVKPSWTGNNDSSGVIIHFQILSDGTIKDTDIEESSGMSSADRSCLRAVIASSPLPPLPRGFKESKLGVHFRFIL